MTQSKLLTIFTPTYNRRELLNRCYQALRRQSSMNFCWLIVDDGSQDGTGQQVRQWMEEENPFSISYIYQPNGGLHTAYNTAIAAADTELFVCIDSDDYPTDGAVERITAFWQEKRSAQTAGMVALNCTPSGEVLGNRLPDVEQVSLVDLYCKHRCRRDLKMIYRTDVLKQYGPIPVYKGEKYMNPYYLFLKIDRVLPMHLMNQVVCVVDYQPDGMSRSILSQYLQSPQSYAELRRMMMSMPNATTGYILKNAVHYVSSMRLAGQKGIVTTAPRKWAAVLALIPGSMLSAVLKWYERRRS